MVRSKPACKPRNESLIVDLRANEKREKRKREKLAFGLGLDLFLGLLGPLGPLPQAWACDYSQEGVWVGSLALLLVGFNKCLRRMELATLNNCRTWLAPSYCDVRNRKVFEAPHKSWVSARWIMRDLSSCLYTFVLLTSWSHKDRRPF